MDFIKNRYYIDFRYGEVLIFIDYNESLGTYTFINVESGYPYMVHEKEIEFIKDF